MEIVAILQWIKFFGTLIFKRSKVSKITSIGNLPHDINVHVLNNSCIVTQLAI